MSDYRAFYKTITNPFGVAGKFYNKAGHHGADFAAAPHQEIPAYFDGVCVKNAYSKVLGNYSVFKRKDSRYAGYAHLLIGTRRNVGERVRPGDSIGQAAGWNDDHGSAWNGAHCHTTVSDQIDGIWNGNTVDPAPSIRRARLVAVVKKIIKRKK